LKTVSEDKIAKAKAQMQLKRAQARIKLMTLPDPEQVLARMQQEYDELLNRMQAYYAAQKQLLVQKRAGLQQKTEQLKQSMSDFDLRKQCEELKANWQAQQRQWQLFIEQYA
jgi:stearoyl-CoA desaturase (delta-9 desaturase)